MFELDLTGQSNSQQLREVGEALGIGAAATGNQAKVEALPLREQKAKEHRGAVAAIQAPDAEVIEQ